MVRATLSFPARRLVQSPGWIAPNGRFFPCSWYEHDSQAEDLARKFYPDETRRKSGTQIFEEKQWVRLLGDGAFRVGSDLQAVPRITQSQRDVLFDLATLDINTDFSRRLLLWLDGAEDS
jgi:hypothetical protein